MSFLEVEEKSYRGHLLASFSGLVALDLKILIFLHFARTVASLGSGVWPSSAAAQLVSSTVHGETPSPTPLLYRLWKRGSEKCEMVSVRLGAA